MADPLNPVVQKMIDAGESEENIATVIRHYKQAAPQVVSPDEPGTYAGGFLRSLKQQLVDAVGPPPSKDEMMRQPYAVHALSPDNEKAFNTPLAHPTGLDAIDGLTSPAGLTTLAIGAGAGLANSPSARGSLGRGMQFVGENTNLMKPLQMVGKVGEMLQRSAEPPPTPPPAPTGPHMDLSTPIRPSAMTQQQIAERIAAVQQAGGLPPQPEVAPKPMLGGRLQMAPTDRPPITVSPTSPMQEPRAAVGAEVVGRQNGMTTQQVRDATGPIRGEAPGTAAGMPVNPKDRIVQKLIDMGPKGQGLPEADREAYAAAGRDPKTRVQVQAYLDALRKVGFVGAGAAGADAVRRAVMERLGGTEQ